jgi:hypothetical protein
MTNPESDSQPAITVEQFNEAVEAVEQHNKQFDVGATMMRVISGQIKVAQKAAELMDAGAYEAEAYEAAEWLAADETQDPAEVQAMEKELVGILNADTLEGVGLELSPIRTKGVVGTRKGMMEIGEVRFRLADGSRFVGFLETASADKEQAEAGVNKVSRDIVAELDESITKAEKAPFIVETLAYANPIAEHLGQFGETAARNGELIKAYAQHTKRGDLREWMFARHTGVLEAPETQRFGPANWHRDITNERLNEKWGQIFKAINAAKQNPHGQALTAELLAAARMNLDAARADWKALRSDASSGYSKTYGAGFDDTYATIDMELAELEDKNNL